jgi:hypothetical protein
MSLLLRFVDIDSNVREEFMAFLQCMRGLSGEQLPKLILDTLNELTLSMDDCRGQGYDDAGAVAWHINGLSANILRLTEIYTLLWSSTQLSRM